jgi:hypothetical protein
MTGDSIQVIFSLRDDEREPQFELTAAIVIISSAVS